MTLLKWFGLVGKAIVAKRQIIGFAMQFLIAVCLLVSAVLQMAIYMRLVAVEKATITVDVSNDALPITVMDRRGIPVRNGSWPMAVDVENTVDVDLDSHSLSSALPVEIKDHSIGSFEAIPVEIEGHSISGFEAIPVEIEDHSIDSAIPVEIEGHSISKAVPVEIE